MRLVGHGAAEAEQNRNFRKLEGVWTEQKRNSISSAAVLAAEQFTNSPPCLFVLSKRKEEQSNKVSRNRCLLGLGRALAPARRRAGSMPQDQQRRTNGSDSAHRGVVIFLQSNQVTDRRG